MPDVRPVWLTEEQALDHGLAGTWDKAPADAERVVGVALHHDHPDPPCPACEDTFAVLRALGMPGA